jgi:hypothetical protein
VSAYSLTSCMYPSKYIDRGTSSTFAKKSPTDTKPELLQRGAEWVTPSSTAIPFTVIRTSRASACGSGSSDVVLTAGKDSR